MVRRDALLNTGFVPYGEDQIINVPKDRHRLTIKQKAEATEYFQHTDFCKICGDKFSKTNLPHIDHCHVTGVIRGKLCRRCNIALGLFKDKIYNLKRAVEYLEQFKYNPDMVEPDIWNT